MTEIILLPIVGIFAENKDIAKGIRTNRILPELAKGNEIILNFKGIEGATQSFIHALISEPIRVYGSDVLEKIAFKNCNNTIKQIISIVVDYMQA